MKALATMKLAAALLCLCLSAHADTGVDARNAAVADIGITGAALALGAVEANPLGVLLIPAKLVLLDYAEGLPTGERETVQSLAASIWTGATANNICVIAAIITGGAFAPVCIGVGITVGAVAWDKSANERMFWQICARERESNPGLICVYHSDRI